MNKQNPMNEMEIAESNNRFFRDSEGLDRALKFRNYKKALELTNKMYREVFERYLRGKPKDKDKERGFLKALFEDSYEISLKLNGWGDQNE